MSRDEHPGPEPRRTAEIVFTARVKADELRFRAAPESRVEFTGDADDDSASGSARTNLPDEVEENVTYRNVRIDYAIAAELRDDEPAGGRSARPPRRR
ncbi:hypothetical protein E1281_07590 [Actinomadura sp. KC345]|uniref:hypothetical protein n=1 Tax=Actinomadura sp. KC345 TaxID=2530371 RepID=UPI00104E346C|nr:hypothetical protein [Actinomadura sp. KC345]TDC56349.1 hypothetical protein E1281_07590 [Actinomadura sp. KC345]